MASYNWEGVLRFLQERSKRKELKDRFLRSSFRRGRCPLGRTRVTNIASTRQPFMS